MTSVGQEFASFYDFYDPPEYRKAQLVMYLDIARETGGPVLELASGTGTISLELARQGYCVTGLDISPDVLSIARDKLSHEEEAVKSRVEFVEGDMAGFELGKDFKVVLIPTNSFGYLTKLDGQKGCLAAAFRHLRSGGSIVIEERLYLPDALTAMLAKRGVPTIQMARVNPATGRYTTFNWITTHVDAVSQTIHSRRFIEEVQQDGTVHRVVPEEGGNTCTHFFSQVELRLLLERAGFEVVALWGGYDRQPVTPSSRSMIFIGKKC